MRDPIRVLVLGTGQMGAGICRLVLEKRGLELVGAFARRTALAGVDLGRALELERDLGLAIGTDLAAVIEKTRPDLAIQATCSRLNDAWPEISVLLTRGVSVISIAEEMAYPTCRSPSVAREMHSLAVQNKAAVLGTGINPGFMLDLLVIALTGVCSEIDSITATRVNDLSSYGPTVLAAQGVGLTPAEFERSLKDKTVAGHYGFPESIHMIADAVGWEIERIEETREPIVSTIRRETPFVTVAPGHIAGCLHTAVAYRQVKPVITLIHPQQVKPEFEAVETADIIEIVGTPGVKFTGRPEVPGGQGTIAIAVNMIPQVLNAAPGLHTMADLPVPAAMLGDARCLVRAPLRERIDG